MTSNQFQMDAAEVAAVVSRELKLKDQEILRKENEIREKVMAGEQQAKKSDDSESFLDSIFGDSDTGEVHPPDLTEEKKQLDELREQRKQLSNELKLLLHKINEIEQASKQQFSPLTSSQTGLAFDQSGMNVSGAVNGALLSFQGAVDLHLQFDAQKLFSRRFSPKP